VSPLTSDLSTKENVENGYVRDIQSGGLGPSCHDTCGGCETWWTHYLVLSHPRLMLAGERRRKVGLSGVSANKAELGGGAK